MSPGDGVEGDDAKGVHLCDCITIYQHDLLVKYAMSNEFESFLGSWIVVVQYHFGDKERGTGNVLRMSEPQVSVLCVYGRIPI